MWTREEWPTTSCRVLYWGEPSCRRQGSPLCPFFVFVHHVVVAARTQVLEEQKPLGGSGKDPARIGCALFYTDVLHMVGKQLLTTKVFKIPWLMHPLVCQKFLNLIKNFWGKTSPNISAWQTSSCKNSPPSTTKCITVTERGPPASKNPFSEMLQKW